MCLILLQRNSITLITVYELVACNRYNALSENKPIIIIDTIAYIYIYIYIYAYIYSRIKSLLRIVIVSQVSI